MGMKLVIAEKPSVGKSIAGVIGADERHDGYMEGGGYIVSWCFGHLAELAPPETYDENLKKWTYETLPIIPEEFSHILKPDTAGQFKVLKSLMERKDVTGLVCATDAGREGELIFRLVYQAAGCRKPFERLWISSMEEGAIRDGFQNLKPGGDYDRLYQAALCRQEADWLVGINGTRLFTILYGGKVKKVGRVQTPTLAMLVDREAAIHGFRKESFSKVQIELDAGHGTFRALSERIDSEKEAEELADKCSGRTALVTAIRKEEKTAAPPKLYDLTTLQRDANRIFGFTAKQTLEYTQSLYEQKLVTYPRTDSQYLTDDMESTARDVIGAISGTLFQDDLGITEGFACDTATPIAAEHTEPNIRRIMNSKKVSDHHAIIPTMEIMKADINALPSGERKILDLIGCRMLTATGEKHIYDSVKAEFLCEEAAFSAEGKSVKQKGWKKYDEILSKRYGSENKGKGAGGNNSSGGENREDDEFAGIGDESGIGLLSSMKEGQELPVKSSKRLECFTKPPGHYTEDSLLKAMEHAASSDMEDDVERKGLGTPATRADIIEKLVKDGYVQRRNRQLIPTDDGMKLITVLPDVVKSPLLTAKWENRLADIAKGEDSPSDFMEGIRTMLYQMVEQYKDISADASAFHSDRKILGKCPKCGSDVLYGKWGAYCTAKCGMNVGRIMGKQLTEEQAADLLNGKKILLKGLTGKSGKKYDAYFTQEGIDAYSYCSPGSGSRHSGYQYKLRMEFPKKSGKKNHTGRGYE